MYFYLINIIILAIQIVPHDSGVVSKLICKMGHEAVNAVNKLKQDIKKVLSCISCHYQDKKGELRVRYKEILNDTILKIMKVAPVRDEDLKDQADTDSGSAYLASETSANNDRVRLDTETEMPMEASARQREASTLTSTTRAPEVSYVARRMSQPIAPSSAAGGRAVQLYGAQLKLDAAGGGGRDIQAHTVVTPDGYLLTLHRIVAASRGGRRAAKGTAILQHGLLGSSMDWVMLARNNSLPYMLMSSGYDVWMANSRGNKYSKAHLTKSAHSSEYWDFSFHEMGLYDLSSTIDYVRDRSSVKSQIVFVAHSMGAAALMVLLSTSPQYNTILSLVILLAPIVFMQQAKGPLRLLSEFQNLDCNATRKMLGGYKFNVSDAFMKVTRRKYCRQEDKALCQNPLLLLADGGKAIPDARLRRNILTGLPAGGSVKSILHFGQLINSGRFEMFDCGTTMNIKKYGTVSPPRYHLREVKLPIAVFNSHDDWLSTAPDIVNLLSYLPNPVMHRTVQSADEFGHLDFLWNTDAPDLVYKHIFDVLDQM